MKCPRCAADNPETDRFCSRCGALLAGPEAPSYDPKRAADLVETAFQLSDRGELSEAIQAAEQAVVLNPRSTSAHSILGILLYRKGDTERAIAEYRVVLSLSPESSADRARLEEIMGRPHGAADRRWRLALVGALATLLLLVALGTYLLLSRRPPPRRETAVAVGPSAAGDRMGATPVVPPLPPRPSPRAPATLPPGPGFSAPTTGAQPPTVVRAQPPETVPTLPPVQPGMITTPVPGSEGALSPESPVSAAEQEARDRYLRGDFEGAIEAYQRTLRELPRAPAQVHEDLALAYMRAGRLQESLAEYRIAAESYRQQIAQGRDVAGARHGLAVCEEAINLLERMP